MIGDHLIGNHDFWRFLGDRDLIGITIVDDRDLSDFFPKMSLSISITLNSSKEKNTEGKMQKEKRGGRQAGNNPTPHTVTVSTLDPARATITILVIVARDPASISYTHFYSQMNFTHFTAVLNYLVFHYYNIYLIL